jgi:hypothetical protein
VDSFNMADSSCMGSSSLVLHRDLPRLCFFCFGQGKRENAVAVACLHAIRGDLAGQGDGAAELALGALFAVVADAFVLLWDLAFARNGNPVAQRRDGQILGA